MNTTINTAKLLQPYSLPSSYTGQTWEGYYVFLERNRDSDALSRSNFDAGLKIIGGEKSGDDDKPLICIVRENHWACGWVEWIAIHESQTEAIEHAEQVLEGIADYPVVDDDLFSDYEQEEANQVWKNCYCAAERAQYIRDHSGQFEFHDFTDLLGCVRGNYFAGYASELLS